MRKILTLLLAVFTLTASVTAQNSGKTSITGVIKDGGQKTLMSATIMLVKAKDSSAVKMTVADKEGNYLIEGIGAGDYMVMVTAVGHQKAFSAPFSISQDQGALAVPLIELEPEVKSLLGVTVVSRKPFIEQKIDRMVVNVEASVTNVGTSALEVLEKSPGITVDRDGNISLKGKAGVMVYIDGRPTYLSGADLANMLRNMSSNQLDQIEIMTNPPAKYDAAGNAGIINIKTKKTKQVGYSGSISASWMQQRYANPSSSLNFNYRKNKVNVFTNIGYNTWNNFNKLSIQRKFMDDQTKEVVSNYDQVSRMRDDFRTLSAKLGMDYSITKKTTLGFVVNGYHNPGNFTNKSHVLISDPSRTLLSKTNAVTTNERTWKNFGANLNMRHVFDSTGTELTMDADYIGYDGSNDQRLINSYFDPFDNPTFKPDTLLGNLPQDIHIFSFKSDFSKPLKNGAKFEAGIKTSFVKTDNNARYDNIYYQQAILDSGRSNHFIYDENVNAAYVNYSRPLGKKWTGQLGLRLENTQASGHSSGFVYNTTQARFVPFDSTFDRDYTQLFPTLYLQYTASEKHSFVLNYGRRINRPDYSDLNPFILFLDRYTFEQGNPNLKPQFAHNIELSHTYKGAFTTTLNYTNTTDIITDVLEQNTALNETVVKKSNIASLKQFGISVSGNIPVVKWWTMNVWLNVFNNLYKGEANGDPISIGYTTGRINVSNQFKFEKGWSAEISGFYTTPFVEGVFRIENFGQMNVGISKQVLKNKGTLRISGRDILYSNKINGLIKYSDIDASFQQVRGSRQVTIGFTYRFSKGKASNSPRRNIGGADEEQNRVKAGQ
ncbi:MAG: TonB-dependent receptor [Chitinophagales bacterium]|nr:TonB-dependent receptor [Chitinophagales bacterium]